ncbi:MAG: hypothetical protein WAU47_05400 [Desulfobaccales bacterium]
MHQKGLGLLLAGKPGSLQVLHHPGQQLAFCGETPGAQPEEGPRGEGGNCSVE